MKFSGFGIKGRVSVFFFGFRVRRFGVSGFQGGRALGFRVHAFCGAEFSVFVEAQEECWVEKGLDGWRFRGSGVRAQGV